MVNVNPTDKLYFDLEIYQVDFNDEKKAALRQEIATKYGVPVHNVIINLVPKQVENSEPISLRNDVIDNIQNPAFQVELFKEYIKAKNITDVNFDAIESIDQHVNTFIDFDSYSKYKAYRFKYVKWNNYLSYGPDNFFDFTQLHGLILLNGKPENQCGKTTFAIDLLRFALFGRAQKSPTLDSVFNVYLPEETEVVVEACIEIDGQDYIIRRTVTRPSLKKRTAKSKAKQVVEYFKSVNGSLELIENCEAENVAATNNIIRDAVGTVEDFNLVISATAYSLGDLLHMGQSDKGKLFSRWLGLLSIEKKEEVAKELWKKTISPKMLSNTYNRETLEQEIDAYENAITINDKNIAEKTTSQNETTVRIEQLNTEKYKTLSAKKNVKEELIKTDVSTVDNQLVSLNTQLEQKRGEMQQRKSQYAVVKDVVYDEQLVIDLNAQIETLQKEMNELGIRNGEVRAEIGSHRASIARINDLMSQGVCPTCQHPIDTNKSQSEISELDKKIEALIQEGVNNKAVFDRKSNEVLTIRGQISAEEIHKEQIHERQTLELKMIAIKSNIDNIKLQINNTALLREEIEQNKENIRINNELDATIRNLDIQIQTETRTKEQLIRDIQQLTLENETFRKEIEQRKGVISKLIEEESTRRHWAIYQELIGKNGIVKIILKKALPVINSEISRILHGLCDFQVCLSVSDDNKVCIDMFRDGKKMDLATCSSGFEGTFAALAIRSALASIATISKPNFLTLDEIDATIAVSNYDNLTELYRRILHNYQFIIHIAHNELLEHIHDMTITVYKENNISKIMVS